MYLWHPRTRANDLHLTQHSFDWNVVTGFIDPLINPFFSTFNFFLGSVFTLPIVAALWYTNTYNTGYLPISAFQIMSSNAYRCAYRMPSAVSNGVFSNLGKRYVVAQVVDDHGLFNQTAYESYSPAYLSAGNILIYGICARVLSIFFGLFG